MEVPDIAFADDLVSITATLAGLQMKADIISGWCMATGVKVAISKLRTFEISWGVDKKEKQTIELPESGGEDNRGGGQTRWHNDTPGSNMEYGYVWRQTME